MHAMGVSPGRCRGDSDKIANISLTSSAVALASVRRSNRICPAAERLVESAVSVTFGLVNS